MEIPKRCSGLHQRFGLHNKPKSILKYNTGWNKKRNYSNNRVRFPSLNTSDATSYISTSDDQSDAPVDTPQDRAKAQGAIPKKFSLQQGKRGPSKNEG